ncbi:MAG: tetratricopeptide repeat protein [Pirellulales bacterium]|nr:tetratricopeptide repeat protein [Pirellulales bacterium]
MFPPQIAPPTFRWIDHQSGADAWLVSIRFRDNAPGLHTIVGTTSWMPEEGQWQEIQRRSRETQAAVAILGVGRAAPDTIVSAATISMATSRDEVGAPLFYREVNLPFREAVKDPSRICWRFGSISSRERPPVVLERLTVCGNCHSFSADGKILGMDVDYANDKGSYAITPVSEEMVLDQSKIITWGDYEKKKGEPTFGLLSQVSPDGRYVISTVKDRSVFVATDDLAFSQLFFPVQGILAIYDRQTKQFHSLPGADDPQYVQSNPVWSPDGKHIVFARSKAIRLKNVAIAEKVLLAKEECREFLEEGKTFPFDLYRMEFNRGKGGKAEPLAGASQNGSSNYFPKYSPDGKWIVFCKAKSFMLLQPDSRLYILPSAGGEPREMQCNTPKMNSWHSWSPNGKWLVFSSKANSPYTQLFLTHIDDQGESSPAVLLERFTAPDRAANIPEFVNADSIAIKRIREQFVDDHSYVRAAKEHYRARDLDSAQEALGKALAINPDNEAALDLSGNILLIQGDFRQAEARFRRLVQHKPDNADAHSSLGAALRLQNRSEEAIRCLDEALRLDPGLAEAHRQLGAALFEQGDSAEAAAHLSEAVRLDPRNHLARFALAGALEQQGKFDQLALQLDAILKQKPDFLPALLGLAGLRAMSGDAAIRNGEEAVKLATRACDLSRYRSAEALHVLAAAYAEAGRYAEALTAAQTAIGIATAAGNRDLVRQIQPLLENYRNGKPARR